MVDTGGVTVIHHTAGEVPALLDEICAAYADAYGAVPGEDITVKTSAFRNRATRALDAPGYSLVAARGDGQLVGFAFGYRLRPDRGWWDGLEPEPPAGFSAETGSRTVVLAEIEVRRAWQGKGVGRAVHDAFLSRRSEERATLSTGPNADAARVLYERWGWQQVGRVPGAPEAYYPYYIKYVLPLDDRR